MNIYNVLEKIRATASKKEKEAILKANDSPELREYLYSVYNPQINYYIKKIPEPVVNGRDVLPYNLVVRELLASLASRELSGNAATTTVASTLGRLDKEDRELLTCVLDRDIKAGLNISTMNKAFGKDFIFEAPYQRCEVESSEKWETWDWNKHHYVQRKADGMFVNVIKTHAGIDFMTRAGNLFPKGIFNTLSWHLNDTLPLDYVTHGELVVYEEGKALPRTTSNGMLNAALQGTAVDSEYTVKLLVWDCIPVADWKAGAYAVDYKSRLQRLNRNMHSCLNVSLIETRIVHSFDEAKAIATEWMKGGEEGAILKNSEGGWKDHTSPNQIKIKAELEVDLEIIGRTMGKGKNKNLFGSLTCISSCGRLKVDVGGYTDELRQHISDNFFEQYMGKIITVKANQLLEPSKSNTLHSLFLPRFIEVRADRTEADSLERIIDVFRQFQPDLKTV